MAETGHGEMAASAGPAAAPAFGERLWRLRLAAGLTQEELAERAGVSARSISDFERGLPHRPRRDTVTLLADALRLGPAERAAFAAAARRPPSPAPAAPPSLRTLAGGLEAPPAPPPLPIPPTALVGREAAVAAVGALLRQPGVRLVTLTGPGGVGKTRLALAVAAALADQWADGAWFVDLAPIRDASLVVPALMRGVGVREEATGSLLAVLTAHLQRRELLLVLDNCEQVAAAAPDLAGLLAACPALTLLATSRAPLRLRAEREWSVPPLPLPAGGDPATPDGLLRNAAVRLFVDRARAVRPDFTLDAANAATVAALAAQLDGLPLAIELAAPLLRLLPPAALLERLRQPLRALVGGARDLPDRQQSLRAAVAWSYDLLTGEQQALFRRLAVFAGGFTLAAATAVAQGGGGAGDGDAWDVLAAVAALAEQSLLRLEPPAAGAAGEPRYAMLGTIREFAAGRLAGDAERDEVRRRHAAYFLALAEDAEAALRGPEQAAWLGRLEREHANLRSALDWAAAAGEVDVALRLAGALGEFWRTRGYLVEGCRRLEQILAMGDGAGGAARAKALYAAAQLATERRELARAMAWFADAHGRASEHGDGRLAVLALVGLGGVAQLRGELAAAEEHYRAAKRQARAAGHAWECAGALTNLALTLLKRGRLAEAARSGEESLALLRQLGDATGEARALLALGDVAYEGGDLARAWALSSEALAVLRRSGERLRTASVLARLAHLAARSGDDERAAACCEESVALAKELGQPVVVAGCLEVLAGLARRQGRVEQAARLLGAAATGRERHGTPRHWDAAALEREAATVRGLLGDAAFLAAWSAGQALALDAAIDVWREERRAR